MKYLLIAALIIISPVFASMDRAYNYFEQSRSSLKYYPLLARELVREGLYFAAVPYMKEFLLQSRRIYGKEINKILETIISEVGTRQFEVLPTRILEKSNTPSIRYILAKKYFRAKKYTSALNLLKEKIPRSNSIAPFALMLKGSVESIEKKYSEAIVSFKTCIDYADSWIGEFDRDWRKRQLAMTRDYCIIGISRTEYAMGNFDEAKSHYLDLSKESYIWPEILFEEAWTSYHLQNYNRTLGKLVTYKAPILSHLFNPEVEVLNALTYVSLCLYEDAQEVVDRFYKDYSNDVTVVEKFLADHGKNHKFYYLVAKERQKGKISGNPLLNNLLNAIIRDPAYAELYQTFLKGSEELKKIKSISDSSFKNAMGKNLFSTLTLQRDLIGAYVRQNLNQYTYQINKTFEHMSYIKLEILGRKKRELTAPMMEMSRDRGSVKYLTRTAKQYFWTFNGEFWADELGDYVFALKSECK
ncbi:MAG: hypothetical protein DRQ88_07620 [Epsilonproteobacteria bacterium]|nr:MAG: hypothetical protein DRQ88_07620 [Campylobacterota bacterium]